MRGTRLGVQKPDVVRIGRVAPRRVRHAQPITYNSVVPHVRDHTARFTPIAPPVGHVRTAHHRNLRRLRGRRVQGQDVEVAPVLRHQSRDKGRTPDRLEAARPACCCKTVTERDTEHRSPHAIDVKVMTIHFTSGAPDSRDTQRLVSIPRPTHRLATFSNRHNWYEFPVYNARASARHTSPCSGSTFSRTSVNGRRTATPPQGAFHPDTS